MPWKLRKREDVESLFPLKKCCCFDLRMGTFVSTCGCFFVTLFAEILVLLDIAEWGDSNFVIQGGFSAFWRHPYWKGFLITDIVMGGSHLLIVIISLVLAIAIFNPTKYRLYHLSPIVRAFYVLLTMHTITEAGVSLYIYSWYGLAAWRLPYLIFCEMFYLLRFCLAILFIIVAWSYDREIMAELMYTYTTVLDTASTDDFQYQKGSGMGGGYRLGGSQEQLYKADDSYRAP